MARILIVDDDKDICNALKKYLEDEDYETVLAHDGEEAIETFRKGNIDLILMDVMMPKMDGLQATDALREITNIPIILLTAKSEDEDKIHGLNTGADDYITKPFNSAEVVARVRSQLRRFQRLGGQAIDDGSVLVQGGIELDQKRKSVKIDGEDITLTPMEYGILLMLMSHPGHVFSSSEIYEHVWNDQSIGNESTVSVHIRHLREKIEIDPSEPRYVKVVWGQGYKLEEQNDRK